MLANHADAESGADQTLASIFLTVLACQIPPFLVGRQIASRLNLRLVIAIYLSARNNAERTSYRMLMHQ
jgi:hypothetical protein